MESTIPIVLTTDKNYELLTELAIRQLKSFDLPKINISVIYNDSSISFDFINYCETNSIRTFFYDSKELNFHVSHHISVAAYIRLFIREITGLEAFIYMDQDIVINRSLNLHDWYNFLDSGISMGAVFGYENWGDNHDRLKPILSKQRLFNSGILFFNFKELEKFQLEILEIYQTHRDYILWHDQDLLNIWTQGRQVYELEVCKWNFIPGFDVSHSFPIIIHYAGQNKPWKHFNLSWYNLLFWKKVILNNMSKEFHFLYYFKRFLVRAILLKGGIFDYNR